LRASKRFFSQFLFNKKGLPSHFHKKKPLKAFEEEKKKKENMS
jgi:hypothetical protein